MLNHWILKPATIDTADGRSTVSASLLMPRSSDHVHPTTTPIRVEEIAWSSKISMMMSSVEDFPLFRTTPICVSSYDASYDASSEVG